MDNRIEKIVKVLQEQAGATFEEFRGEVHILIDAGQVVDALTFLRDEHQFSLLSAMTAVDYWPQARSAVPCHLPADVADTESFGSAAGAGQRQRAKDADGDGRFRRGELARARGHGHVWHRVRRPSRSTPHPDAR